jgi:hypothetical protein
MRRAKIRRCNFNEGSLEGATVHYTFIEDSLFERVRFVGVNISNCTFLRVSMAGATLTNARWQGSVDGDLRECDFSGSDLRELHFRNADLRGTNFANVALAKSTLKRVRLHGAHGLPFIADQIGGSELDFSPEGNGSVQGTVATFRRQLGGESGTGPWGTATDAEQYQAFRVDTGVDQHFSIERRSDHVEVICVVNPIVASPCPAVHYQVLDHRFVNSVAQDLIAKVLLIGLLEADFRGKLDAVEYKNIGATQES